MGNYCTLINFYYNYIFFIFMLSVCFGNIDELLLLLLLFNLVDISIIIIIKLIKKIIIKILKVKIDFFK